MTAQCVRREKIIDYATGREIEDCDDEIIRQRTERFLVEQKGYYPEEISVDSAFDMFVDGVLEKGRVELLITLKDRPFMTLKCRRGSLVTREREALAASRLIFDEVTPFTVVTNSESAEFLDSVSGKVLAEGLDSIPARDEALKMLDASKFIRFDDSRREKESRIYLAFADLQCPVECH